MTPCDHAAGQGRDRHPVRDLPPVHARFRYLIGRPLPDAGRTRPLGQGAIHAGQRVDSGGFGPCTRHADQRNRMPLHRLARPDRSGVGNTFIRRSNRAAKRSLPKAVPTRAAGTVSGRKALQTLPRARLAKVGLSKDPRT